MPHCTLATVPPTRNSAIFLRSLAGGSGVLSSPGSSGRPSLAWAALRTLWSAALGRKRDLGWALAAPRGRFSSAAASGPSCTGGLWSCPRSRWQAGTCSVTWRPLPSEGGARKGCQPVRAHSREGWGSPPPGGHRWNCWALDGGGGAGTVAQTPTKPGAWAAQSLNLSRPGLAGQTAVACSPPPTALAGLLAGGRLLTRLVAESGDGLVFCLPADTEGGGGLWLGMKTPRSMDHNPPHPRFPCIHLLPGGWRAAPRQNWAQRRLLQCPRGPGGLWPGLHGGVGVCVSERLGGAVCPGRRLPTFHCCSRKSDWVPVKNVG